ncbi:MAG TPA: 3-oxoacyl-[acyl-carrier-protein] synthase III C-terminal domain-containing protein [Kofleriaceae bacterium]|nr:3-oxoacyl-[acyl-carrier-protein] synthase III C-terminal domain-containing protein [Kofleriaceae bacterium]
MCVLGGGTAFPRHVLSNEEVLRTLPAGRGGDEQRRFLAAGAEETIGVRSRAWAHRVGTPLDPAHEESSFDLAVTAARAALADAGLDAAGLGLILCATSTPHRMTSTLSAAVGAALGAGCPCIDTRTGCSAGLFALTTAALYLGAGIGPVLLVGAETFSKIIPPGSRLAALSLGDGAGALVLGLRPEAAGLRAAFLQTDGTLGRLISTDGALPPTAGAIAEGGYFLSGQPEELSQVVPSKYEEALGRVLARAALPPAEVDLFVPHQTSRGLIAEVCRRVGIPAERAFVNVERHANIGAAGWVVALVEARQEGRCPPGTRLALAATGGGMSWAAAVLGC